MGGLGWGGCECGGGYLLHYACTCNVHMHTHAHRHHMHVKHDKHGCLHVSGHLQFLYMYTCACVHVCVCVCACMHMHMCMCLDTPSMPSDTPPPTCSLHRATGSPKHQNSICLELIKIIQFCLKILTSKHS